MKLTSILATLAVILAGCTATGEAAPAFELTDSQGQIVSLSDFEGRPVVLFFASVNNCISCIVETKNELLPLFEEANGTIDFLTISVLPQYESDEDLERFKEQTGATWSHARDTSGVTQSYKIAQLSTIVVLDEDHRIQLVKVDPSKDEIIGALA